MKGPTVLVGWRGPVPPCVAGALRLEPSAIFFRPLVGIRAVVLGPEALEKLSPKAARAALARVSGKVVLCTGPRTAHVIVDPWRRHGFPNPVAPEDLADALAALRIRRPRPRVAPEDWLPRTPPPGSDAARAVRCVPELPDLRVQSWADALGCSRSYLLALCVDAFGASPKELLLRYARAAFETLRGEGLTFAECADLLDYADEKSLRRAVAQE
jgi:AraC-like DNA-binding protein